MKAKDSFLITAYDIFLNQLTELYHMT